MARKLVALILVSSLSALVQGSPVGNSCKISKNTLGAAYFLSNSRTSNAVISAYINSDGTLTPAGAHKTGGKGGVGLVNPPAPVHADPLFGQHSVVVDGNMLFAVNADSDTFSAFEINKKDPTQLRLVGTKSTGAFPVSVASTPIGKSKSLTCVLNAGNAGSMNCYETSPKGITALKELTVHSFGIQNQSRVPLGPLNTVSDLAFDGQGNLVVAIKAPAPNATGGGLTYFPVKTKGKVALGKPTTVATPAPGGGPFAISVANDGSNSLFVADVFVGNSLYQGGPNGSVDLFPIPGQQANCWTAQSTRTGSFFSTDIVLGNIQETKVTNGSAELIGNYSLGLTAGTTDLQVASTKKGDFLYVLVANETSVAAFNVNKAGQAKLLQKTKFPKQLKLDAAVAGMATYIK